MWFRNIQLYRLPEQWDMTAERLAEQLSRLSFQPCGSQDMQTQGWAPPLHEDLLVHSVGGHWLIALGVEARLLPSSVVKQVADDRAVDIEAQQGFKPGRKQMKELKEAVVQELLPRAFTRRRRVYAWIDPKAGFLAIDAASRTAAEPLVEALHKALDELPLKLLNTERSPGAAMTDWLAAGEVPGAFSIDEDCELRAIDDEASAVRYVRHSLEGHEIREHIASGKQVSKLALTFDDKVSFILTDKFEIKRVHPLDVLTEKGGEGDAQSREEQFDADFAMMTGEMRRLFPALFEALGGEVKTI
jgi:recombination associated protein RdgC